MFYEFKGLFAHNLNLQYIYDDVVKFRFFIKNESLKLRLQEDNFCSYSDPFKFQRCPKMYNYVLDDNRT